MDFLIEFMYFFYLDLFYIFPFPGQISLRSGARHCAVASST